MNLWQHMTILEDMIAGQMHALAATTPRTVSVSDGLQRCPNRRGSPAAVQFRPPYLRGTALPRLTDPRRGGRPCR